MHIIRYVYKLLEFNLVSKKVLDFINMLKK